MAARRNRLSKSKENSNVFSNIPKPAVNANGRRSSSVDCASRGSYLPSKRRPSSLERFKTPGSLVKLGRRSPKRSDVNLFAFQRGSFLERRGIIKDHRPLADRAYQKQSICTLVEYLEDAKFPFTINPSNLMPPTKKDFEKIFQFLYNMWDSKYEVKKIEDEAPKLLKIIGYPYIVNKSSFLTINRMSWPSLLGILMWLLELNRAAAAIDMYSYVKTSDFQKDDGHGILLNFILKSFGSEADDPEKDEEIFTTLVSEKYNMEYSVEELETEINKVEAENEEIKKEKKEFDALLANVKVVEKDIENFGKFSKEMEVHMTRRTDQLQVLKEMKEAKETELLGLQKEVEAKDAVYKAQGFNAKYAQNYYDVTKADLKEKLELKKKNLKEDEKLCWDLELALYHLGEQNDGLCQHFSPLWNELRDAIENVQLVLSNSNVPAARKMSKITKPVLPEFQMFPRCIDDVRSVLEKVKKYVNEQSAVVQSIILTGKNSINETEIHLSDLAVKDQMLSAQLAQKEREMEIQRKENEREISAVKFEQQALEKKLNSISEERLKIEQSIGNLKKKVKKLNLEKEEGKRMLVAEQESFGVFKQEILELFDSACKRIEVAEEKVDTQLKDLLQKVEETPP